MKKKAGKLVGLKKWIVAAVCSIVVLPALALSWKNIQAIWANPEKTYAIEKKVDKHETAQESLARLVVEQQARMDKQEAIDSLQIQSMKEQLALVAELRKEKK